VIGIGENETTIKKIIVVVIKYNFMVYK